MMSDHEADLLELAGSHGWRALLEERRKFLEQFRAQIETPATCEFDFVRKEVASGVLREVSRFFVGVEQTMDELAKQSKRT